MLFPDHNYLGPGNSINNGEPVDTDDRIAQVHDIEYSNARSFQDIQNSDYKAIKEFSKDFIYTGNYHSALGATGLSTKYLTEKIIGKNIYPIMDADSTDYPNKRPRSEDVSERLNKSQAGGSMPGGTGSSVQATIILNPKPKNPCLHYRKTFQLYTAGLQFEKFSPKDLFAKDVNQRIIDLLRPDNVKCYVTPLANLNPDYLGIFMSPAEYDNLPTFSYAKNCKIKVTPLGYRLPFATNEATSTYANSQTIVQIASAVGLNTQYNFLEAGYLLDQTDLTNVGTLINANASDYTASLYGSAGNVGLGACMGIPRYWNNYATIINYEQDEDPSFNNISNPMLINFMKIQNVNDCKGTPIINYRYDYKNGLLKFPDQFQRRALHFGEAAGTPPVQQSNSINYGFENIVSQIPLDTSGTANKLSDVANRKTNQLTGSLNYLGGYNQRVEKCHWLTRQPGQNLTADRPPLVHFGCMPVQSNAAMANKATFANVCVIWQIETEMEVEYTYDFVTAGTDVVNFKSFDPLRLDIYDNQDQYNTAQLYITNKFPIRSIDNIK